ncbi:hypothetical protein F7Q92_13790 [Ideonella dechloratans]|uniref:Uncharacterized protein n=1 Tax=Ideonella dechloratans TaxID=36863 RepID=A0A643FAA9_IDEDE|nr:hypothetical protein [Ideonella dechloratans]KAB0580002.1 hypothetical protein F7Q92_13790 [Ideonella dechloratans]UFU10941.1 hypothetical protein LRM40_04470 [Ideonella dechloratans]
MSDTVLEPTVLSTQWRDGDLEVLFTQGVPCGDWLPINPQWTVDGLSVNLDFHWTPQFPDQPAPTKLCKKFVRAWVFRVPRGAYQVSFGGGVQRFDTTAVGITISERRK